MVVGKSAVLAGPQRVTLKRAHRAGRRQALLDRRARRRSPALAGTGVCVPADATTAPARAARATPARSTCAGSGRSARGGRDGWVYKVGRRAGSAGAADPPARSAPGASCAPAQRVLWFWCVKDAGDSCQRTLAVAPARAHGRARRAAARHRARLRRHRRGVPVAGATVRARRRDRRHRRRRRRDAHRARRAGTLPRRRPSKPGMVARSPCGSRSADAPRRRSSRSLLVARCLAAAAGWAPATSRRAARR